MMGERILIGLKRDGLIIGIEETELNSFGLTIREFFVDCEVAIVCPPDILQLLDDRTMKEALSRRKGGPEDLLWDEEKEDGRN